MFRAAMLLSLASVVCLLLPACGGETQKEYDEVRALERSPRIVPPGTTSEERFGLRRSGGHAGSDPHAATSSAPAFDWTTPEGWEEVKGSSMRAASWRVKGEPLTDCSLSMLPGRGGDVLSNVNRWCKQMGAAELDAEALETLPRVPMLGQQALLLSIAGSYGGMRGAQKIDDARMLGAILELSGVAVFLKFTGPAKVVEAQEASFSQLAASVRIKAHGGGSPSMGSTPPPKKDARAPFQWTVPDGWEERGAKSMRVVTVAPAGADTTECYVSVLGGDGGGLEANVNRWQAQMGQPALSTEQIGKLERVDVLGTSAVLVRIRGTFRGMGGKALDDATMYGMVCEKEGFVVFAKMYGPSTSMPAEWDNFVAFCKSIRQ